MPSSITKLFYRINLYSHLTRSSLLSSFLLFSAPKDHLYLSSFKTLPLSSIPEAGLSGRSSSESGALLEETRSKLTHESVIYGIKRLEKDPQNALEFFTWVSDKSESKLSPTACNIMLRILVRKESMKEFWILLNKMSDRGYELDWETYETLLSFLKKAKMSNDASLLRQFFSSKEQERASDSSVSAVVESLMNLDWGGELETKLDEIQLPISERTILKVLKEIREYPIKALGFFQWVHEHSDYKHNAVTYNAILRVLGQDCSIHEFWSLVKEMKSEGFEIDIDTYVKLLRQFQRKKMMKEAVQLYELMLEGPYKPSTDNCSLLLRMISLNGTPDVDLVFRVVKKFEESGYSLSKAVYDGIHRSMTSVGMFDEAEKMIETMKSAGFEPDNITYSQLVFGLCKFQRFDEACKVMDNMETEGCVPDVKTWTVLIQGHCLVGEVDEALHCFTKMIEKNCEADADLIEILVNGLISTNRVEEAYKLVVEMVKTAHLRPWQSTYTHLIGRLLREEKLKEALKVLGLLKSHNFPPHADPFVSYLSKFGTVDDAVQFLKALSVKRYPSSSSYQKLLEAFFKEGRHAEAQDLLYKCPHHIRSHADILNLFGASKTLDPA